MTSSTTRVARRGLHCACGLVAVGLLASVPGADGAGGLVVSPLRIDASPRPGVIGRIDVGNPSNEKIKVTVTPRRWRQAPSGRLTPGGKLRALAVDARTFTLAPRQHKLVAASLRRAPAGGYLYATIVTHGVSARRHSGLQPGYRIVTAVHVEPPAGKRRARLAIARPRVVTKGRRAAAFEIVTRNLGNMSDPVSGAVTVHGRGRSHVARIKSMPILPRSSVRLTTVALKGLRPGRYMATARVSQRGGGHATSVVGFSVTRAGKVVRRRK